MQHKLIPNLKRFFWCLFHRSLYKTDLSLTILLYKLIPLIDSNLLQVSVDPFHLFITSDKFIIQLWNENKWYAWLSNGQVNGDRFQNLMPSLKSMYDFKECLKRNGFDPFFNPKPAVRLKFLNEITAKSNG